MLHWGVYFIVISIVFRELGTVYIASLTLNQFVIIITFLAALYVKLFQKQDFSIPGKLTIALIIFGFYIGFSNFFFNQDTSWGIGYFTNYFRSFICYFLVVTLIDTKKKIKFFLMSYIIASVAMVLTGNLYGQYLSGFNLSNSGARSGLEGLAGHYIMYAQIALISIPLTYSFIKGSNNRFKQMLNYMIMALLAFGCLFSGSRGAVLTLFVMIFSISIVELRQREQRIRSPWILLSFSFIIMFLLSLFWIKGGAELFESIFSVFSGKPADLSLAGRLYIQKHSFSLFLNNPFFGSGPDSTRHLYGMVTHDQWLQILSELGIVGILLALTVVYFLFKGLFACRHHAYLNKDYFIINTVNAMIVSIFSILFWGLYENTGLLQAEKILFMLFGLSEAIRRHIVTKDLLNGDQKKSEGLEIPKPTLFEKKYW